MGLVPRSLSMLGATFGLVTGMADEFMDAQEDKACS